VGTESEGLADQSWDGLFRGGVQGLKGRAKKKGRWIKADFLGCSLDWGTRL